MCTEDAYIEARIHKYIHTYMHKYKHTYVSTVAVTEAGLALSLLYLKPDYFIMWKTFSFILYHERRQVGSFFLVLYGDVGTQLVQ
jgi:hypothetical protein